MKLMIKSDLVFMQTDKNCGYYDEFGDWIDEDWEAIDKILVGYSVKFTRSLYEGLMYLAVYAQDVVLHESEASQLFSEIFERFFDDIDIYFGGTDGPGSDFVLSIT